MSWMARCAVLLLSVVVGARAFADRGPQKASEAIHIQIGGEPSTLDPLHVVDQYGFSILRNVVEGLFKLDPDGKLTKGLVSEYEISKDQLTYKFRLRADAKWSDGRPVTIEDCIFGLERAVDPKTASPNADEFFAIEHARAIFESKLPPTALGVSRSGEQLVIKLDRKDPALLMELTFPAAGPLRKDVYDANGGAWTFRSPTTGDYFIKSYRVSDEIELEPNPYHLKPGQMRIVYHILPEEITAMNLFESGRIDVISTVTMSEIPRLRKLGLIQSFPSTTVFYLSFNVSKPPFNDPVWRKAVAGAVNRGEISRILRGAFDTATNLVPTSIDPNLPAKNLDKKFTAEMAQIHDLKDKPRVHVAYGSSEFTRTVLEKLQQDFLEKLGLRMLLEPTDLKSLLGHLLADPPEMYFLGLSALYDDPIHHLNAFSTGNGPNYSRYQNKDYDKMYEEVRAAPLGPERRAIVRKANDLLVEKDVVVVPIVLRLQNFGVSKSLKGFHASPYQVIQLNALSK